MLLPAEDASWCVAECVTSARFGDFVKAAAAALLRVLLILTELQARRCVPQTVPLSETRFPLPC